MDLYTHMNLYTHKKTLWEDVKNSAFQTEQEVDLWNALLEAQYIRSNNSLKEKYSCTASVKQQNEFGPVI